MAKKSLQLGRAVEWPDRPEKAVLDRVPNPQAGTDYLVRFAAPEFIRCFRCCSLERR